VSALCPCAHLLCIFHTWLRQHCRRLLLAAGLVWLQCDQGSYSNPRVLVQSKGDIAARCPGTGSTWQSCLTPHMPAAHSLLLQACSGCSMGTGFAQQHSSTLSVWSNLDTAAARVSRHTAHALCGCKGHAVHPTQGYSKCCCKLVLTCL
jgi:hypothetical protein